MYIYSEQHLFIYLFTDYSRRYVLLQWLKTFKCIKNTVWVEEKNE